MKKLIMTLAIAFCAAFATAQEYQTAIGFRGGFQQGLTIKHFIGSDAAIEGIIATRWKGYNITGLYELHANAFETPGLNWYYGFGGHIGGYNGYDNHPYFHENRFYTILGVDAILGIEYNISEIPINISADWKPAFNILGYTGFWGDQGAISVRYYF